MKCDKKTMLLYAVTDRAWVGRQSLYEQVECALKGGATCVQVREKKLGDEDFLEEAKQIAALCKRYGVPLFINDNVDVAIACGAEGVHVGQGDLPALETRRLIGPDKILGLSVGSAEEMATVPAAGVDYLGIGPVYPTGTKADAGEATGVALFAELVAATALPVVAIGGIHRDNCSPLFEAGTDGVAVVSAICGRDDPARATAALNETIQLALKR